jgi:hypothetical protein
MDQFYQRNLHRCRLADRRSVGLFVGYALVVAVLAGASWSSAQTVVDLSPAAGTVDCAGILYVDVTVDNTLTDLRGFSFTFGFDPTVVTPVSVAVGDLLAGAACQPFLRWNNETSFVNTIEVDGSLLGCSAAGPGAIIRIGFAPGPNRGPGALTMVSGRLRDSVNNELAFVPPAGTVENVCNTPPVANPDAYTLAEDGTINAIVAGTPPGVLDNDTDFDTDALSATLVTAPPHALSFTLNLDGSFDYVHNGDEAASDQFVYLAADGQGGSAQGTATITVTPVNDLPVVTNPGPQAATENGGISLQIVAADAEQVALLFTATGLPAGLTLDLNTGLIAGVVACGAATGSPYTVSVDVDDQVGGVGQVVFAWDVAVQVAPPAITDLAAVQVKTGNGVDGTTAIVLTWSGVVANNSIAVYRKGFGFYPEYDDLGGAAPAVPASPSQAVTDGWTPVAGVTASGQTDEPAVRDSYYYVAFVLSECSSFSAVSNLAGGVLNYHLGDVTDGVTPGQGDNAVGSIDVSLLGFHYAVNDLDPLYLGYLDVGPTTNNSPDGRPTTDNVIEFEDLMMFSLNYVGVGKRVPLQAPKSANVLTLIPGGLAAPGTTVEVPLYFQADGQIHGMSIDLNWNADVVSLVSHTAGPLLDGQGGPTTCFLAGPGLIDIAVFGSTAGLTGAGVVATVTFEVLAAGDPGFGFGTQRVRGAQNQEVPLTVQIDTVTPVPGAAPAVSGLYANYPNPFNPSTTIRFGVGQAGRVDLRVYGVDGRLVRTLRSRDLVPGTYSEVWDGNDERGLHVASGIYFVRLGAPDRSESRQITLLK